MKPEPKVTKTVCTLCGLDWGLHGTKPTAEKCVELLKAELARRPAYPIQVLSTNSATSAWNDYQAQIAAATTVAKKRAKPPRQPEQ